MAYAAARTATRDEDASRYQRHRPEQTLLYRIVEEYYPAFAAHLASLPIWRCRAGNCRITCTASSRTT